MSIQNPQTEHYDDYMIAGNAVFYKSSQRDVQIMGGIARITESILCPNTGHISYVLKVNPFIGKPSSLRVTMEDLTGKKLKRLLGQMGLVLHDENRVARYLTFSITEGGCAIKSQRTLIDNAGFFDNGRGAYTGRKTISAGGMKVSKFWFEPIKSAPVIAQHTLSEWKQNIGVHIEHNPVLLATACIFIASVFLKQCGIGSRIINLHGAKGTGKTLTLQCGATIWGSGIDPAAGRYSGAIPYVTKFSTTRSGLEILLARSSPFPIALDEATEQDAKTLRDLLYEIASGEGKHRATSQMLEAESNEWLLTVVTTAEKSIADAVTANGKPLLGGQSDRAIDVPIDRLGIITNHGQFDGVYALNKHLKQVCGMYYGSAGETILQFAVDHPNDVRDVLAELPEIENRLVPINCGHGERRVVQFMAAAVVAGNIGILAGVFDSGPEAIENSVKLLVEEWWMGRGGCLRRIAEFIVACGSDVTYGPPILDSQTKAFIYNDNVMIPCKTLEDEFRGEADAIISDLIGLNALVRDTKNGNRTKMRYANNMGTAYVIKFDRIQPLLQEIILRQSAADIHSSGIETNRFEDVLMS